jgi:hypothetical protein
MRVEPPSPRALRSRHQGTFQTNPKEPGSTRHLSPEDITHHQMEGVPSSVAQGEMGMEEIQVPLTPNIMDSESPLPSHLEESDMEEDKACLTPDMGENQVPEPLDSSITPPPPSDLQIRLLALLSDQSSYLAKAKVMVTLPSQAPPSKLKVTPLTQKSKRKPQSIVGPKGGVASGSKVKEPLIHQPTKFQEEKRKETPAKQMVPVEDPQNEQQGRPSDRGYENQYLAILKALQVALSVTRRYYSKVDGKVHRTSTQPFLVSNKTFSSVHHERESLQKEDKDEFSKAMETINTICPTKGPFSPEFQKRFKEGKVTVISFGL